MYPAVESHRAKDDPLDGTPYCAISMLGKGGMGVVWRAVDRRTGETVAVKVMHESLASDAENLERFRTEAEVAGLIAHPNVVRVLELRMPPAVARPYFVMEALVGETVLDRLRRCGAFPVDEAIAVARQTLEGLAAVHAAGVVHRDIKPSNIFLCHERETIVVKLLDFGIAKLLPVHERAPQLTPHTFETSEGTFLGTALYASPEQVGGRPVDRRSDVFALGNVLYNMLTGRSPFGHIKETRALLLLQRTRTPQPPSKVARSPIPPELDELVMAALAKHAERRFPSAEAFAQALNDVASKLAAPPGWLKTHHFEPVQTSALRSTQPPQPVERPAVPRNARRSAHRRPRARRSVMFFSIAVIVGCYVALAVVLVVRLG